MSKNILIFSSFIAISVMSVALITPAQALVTASDPGDKKTNKDWFCLIVPNHSLCADPLSEPEQKPEHKPEQPSSEGKL